MKLKLSLAILLLNFVLMACKVQSQIEETHIPTIVSPASYTPISTSTLYPSTPAPSLWPTNTPKPRATQTPTAVKSPTPKPPVTVGLPPMTIAAGVLQTNGPWVVFTGNRDEDGFNPFYMMKIDGSELTHLGSFRTNTAMRPRFPRLSPNGFFMASQIIVDLDLILGIEKQLVIFDLRSHKEIAKFPVVSPTIISMLREKGEDLIENMYSDEMTAIKASGEMLWSPDSRYLAYTAAVDGPSSDLYVFDTQTLTTKRLSDNPVTQVSLMAWSPDRQSLDYPLCLD